MTKQCRTGKLVLGMCALMIASCTPDLTVVLSCGGVSTSFEFTDTTGAFTLGDSPASVTFAGGSAQRIGITSLYRTGLFAWMVAPGETGTITFETPAREVTLYFRDQTASGPTLLDVLDTEGTVIATFEGTTAFDIVGITIDPATENAIGSIVVRNQSATSMTSVEDFSFCAVEENDGDNGPVGLGLADPIPKVIPVGDVRIRLETVATGLVAPNWGTNAPGVDNQLFVTDQDGTLWSIDLTTGEKSVFLDVSDRIVELGVFGPDSFDERGLLGVAFHPEYQSLGTVYTYTSEPVAGAADFSTMPEGVVANHQSVITEWQVSDPTDPSAVVNPASARELMRIDQPQFNHDGGCLNFGPDGMLYVSLGDGGGADDADGQDFFGGPMIGHGTGGNGQDPTNPLGTVLRIDPFGTNAANGRYGIPADNPFLEPNAPTDFVDEIFAYGFRNPFRFSFDSETGALYLADVGQNDIEEIDIVLPGGNFGWNLKEGSFFFETNGNEDGFVTDVDPGVPPDLIDPIAEYDHDEGIAIIGGFVYRGTAVPELVGRYVFGDFARTFASDGRLFYLDQTGEIAEFDLTDRGTLDMALLGFGRDAAGEIYVLANATGTPFGETGIVFRITAADENTTG